MKTILTAASLALVLSACATQQFPAKRPMPEAQAAAMKDVPVVVVANEDGITKSWFMKDNSAAGAQYGLIGALTTSVIDAVINTGPMMRAQRAADEVAEVTLADALDASLTQRLEAVKAAGGEGASLGEVRLTRQAKETVLKDEVELNVSYVLSEDASAMRVVAVATLESDAAPYVSPYIVDGKTPKSQRGGPFYRNSFVYHADPFVVPVMTPALKTELVASVKELFRTPEGKVPVEGDDDYKKMIKAIEAAKDDKLTKSETAVFLVRKWTKNDGEALRGQIAAAHDFIAEALVMDLTDTTVPILDGSEVLLSEAIGGRVVRRKGSGVEAGSYVSSPGGLTGFTTYGNAVRIAEKNREATEAFRKEAKEARKMASKNQR